MVVGLSNAICKFGKMFMPAFYEEGEYLSTEVFYVSNMFNICTNCMLMVYVLYVGILLILTSKKYYSYAYEE